MNKIKIKKFLKEIDNVKFPYFTHHDSKQQIYYIGHPEFFKIIEKMKEIHSNKSHDYAGTGGDPFANLKLSTKMGIPYWKGCLVRIGDKFSRLCSFARQGELQVRDESIEDTLIDMANYAVICLILYREGKKEDEHNKNS
jgi:hypothetical protein